MTRDAILRRRIRFALGFMMMGLVLSGVTAIPLVWELELLVGVLGGDAGEPGGLRGWLIRVRDGLAETDARYPFIAYGTDWLAFAHVVIAIAFVGPWRDPVRNVWVVDFGIIACILIVPMALVFGPIRGIPFGWQVIECSFGVVGLVPLLLARRWTGELSRFPPEAP